MPIDHRILLNPAVPDVVNALRGGMNLGAGFKTNRLAQTLNQQKIDQGAAEMKEWQEGAKGRKEKQLNEREMSRLKSMYVGAVQLKPYLDAGDTQGAMTTLQRRKAMLQEV